MSVVLRLIRTLLLGGVCGAWIFCIIWPWGLNLLWRQDTAEEVVMTTDAQMYADIDVLVVDDVQPYERRSCHWFLHTLDDEKSSNVSR